MSNESNNLDPIVAGIGFNDGANKGFWRHQPRDAKKQWMEMGAEVRALFNKMRKDGTMGQVSVVGRVAGSTGSADQARVLIQGDADIPDGIYAINSDSLEAVEAHLSDSYLKSQGIDPSTTDKHGNPIDGLKAQDFDTTERADITQDDIDLVNQGAVSDKGKEMSKFKDSDEGKAIDAADAKPTKTAPAAKAAKSDINPAASKPSDKGYPSYIGQDDWRIIQEARKTQGGTIRLLDPNDPNDKAIMDAWSDAQSGKAPDLDIVINAAKGPSTPKPSSDVKKLIDLNPGDQIVSNKGDVFTYVTHKPDGNGKQRLTLKAADGTTTTTSVDPNHQFKMAPKAAPAAPKKAANAKPLPAHKPATSKQVDEIDNLADKVANDATIDPAVKKSYDDLVAKLDNGDDVSSDEAKAVLDQVKNHYGQKTTPKAAPTIVAPKKAPAAPKPLPDVSRKSASEIALAKKRMDDGSDIALNTDGKSEADFRNMKLDPLMDENGKPLRDPNNPKKIVQDPNAIVNALLENFPDAKVQGDNDRIILERRDYTDVDGKEYKFELGLSRTYGNQFIQHYKFTDKNTGEVREFQTADYKDSFAGIFGKTNGVLRMRDQLIGEGIPGNKLTRELATYFGPNKNLDSRLKYFRKGSDLYGYRVVTPQENIQKFLDGTDVKHNMSMAQTGIGPDGEPRYQFGNVIRGQVTPFWKSIENKDWPGMKFRITQLLGRMPDNAESRKLLIDTLRDQAVSHFKGVNKAKSYHTYANLLDKYLDSNKVDLRDIYRTPYTMGDGNTVAKVGDKVFYFPNHDEYSVGTIVGFHATNGKNGGYHDSVSIQFADGTVVTNLQTRNSFPAGPDSEFGDADLTNYTKNVKLDKKLALRKAMLGPAYDAFMQKRKADKEAKRPGGTTKSTSANTPSTPDTTDDSDDNANPNAGAPLINSNGQQTNSSGQVINDDSADPTPEVVAPDANINTTDETGKDATPEAPKEGNVTKLQPNDSWYDENGDYKGVVVETQEVPAQDGGDPGLAVFYIDENGDEAVEIVEKSEDRGPK
jgi:hypothetical protein